MKNVTVKDAAKAAVVSCSTAARSMVMKSTKLLGLIPAGVNNHFMLEPACLIDRQARAREYGIILCSSSRDLEQERKLFNLMIGRQADGAVLIPPGLAAAPRPAGTWGLTPQYCNGAFSATSIKCGCQLAKQFFARERTYSAMFAATDTNALGIMQAAEETGVRIPEDFSLLGFDIIRDSGLPRTTWLPWTAKKCWPPWQRTACRTRSRTGCRAIPATS